MIKKFSSSMKFNFSILVCFLGSFTFTRPPINIFRPSDRPLLRDYSGTPFQLVIGDESSVRSVGFQDDFDQKNQLNSCSENTKVNVLRIYEDKQSWFAAVKGCDSNTKMGQYLQSFNLDVDNGNYKSFIPCGNFKVPFNILMSAYYYFNCSTSLSLHLPYLSMELTDVTWDNISNDYDSCEFIKSIRKKNCLNLTGYKREGFGDLVILGRWMMDLPQDKPFLKNVKPQIRLGLNIPTGEVQDEDQILGFAFGNDGAWGIQLAGGLDLDFLYGCRFGLDAQFLFLFGNTKCRRVKTNCNQTDLLFLNKETAYKEFGLGQQFNLFLEHGWNGLGLRLDYQYLKRNEDKLFAVNERFDPSVINSAENLQEWTAHSLIFSLKYDFCYNSTKSYVKPSILAWFKLGFNGKRAILLDTLGATFALGF